MDNATYECIKRETKEGHVKNKLVLDQLHEQQERIKRNKVYFGILKEEGINTCGGQE